MRAVIYARYSSSGQRDVSIEDQVREIKQFAKSHNYTIINVYADRAMTGRNDKRPQFRKMIADAEKGLFKVVLVYKHDRFARNQYDAIIYKHRLSEAKVKLIAVMEPIPDGHGARILESIYLAMAEEYSENLSQNVRRGQKGNALKAMANHPPAFGYRINHETHKFEPDPETAPLVQEIFRMILDGKQGKEVLAYMKSIGKPRSSNWLYHLLQNERYTGVYIYGDVRIEGGMPQLINKSDFEKVRCVMELRKHTPQARPYQYAFSGRIYCGECGTLMSGEYAIGKSGKQYRYYTCIARKKRLNDCPGCRISADLLEEKSAEALRNTLFAPEVLDRLSDDVYKCYNETIKVKLSSVQAELSDVVSRMNNIQKNIEKVANVPDVLIERLAELDKQKKELSAKIECEQQKYHVPKNYIKDYILSCKDKDDRSLLNTFVTKITVYEDHAVLEYDASGDNEIELDFEPHPKWRTSLASCSNIRFYVAHARLYIKIQFSA